VEAPSGITRPVSGVPEPRHPEKQKEKTRKIKK